MKYTIQNLAQRPVSIICNSGKAFHLPPKYKGEFSELEVKDNAMIAKLQGRKILSVLQAAKKKDEKMDEASSDTASGKTNKSSKSK